jgi:hypothetical protein
MGTTITIIELLAILVITLPVYALGKTIIESIEEKQNQ